MPTYGLYLSTLVHEFIGIYVRKLSKFKDSKVSPIRTALVTARCAPTHERVIKTLNIWGVRIDEAFFLGGSEKYEVLEAFGADIFFDDQDIHLTLSSSVVPSAKVISKNVEKYTK